MSASLSLCATGPFYAGTRNSRIFLKPVLSMRILWKKSRQRKQIALADPARNEPRDLYDLWYLTSDGGIEMDHLIPAICEKLEFRGKPCQGLQPAIARKEARLEALWTRKLAHQLVSLPPFEQVFRALRRTLRQADLP